MAKDERAMVLPTSLIYEALSEAGNGKGAGVDTIPAEAWKEFNDVQKWEVAEIFRAYAFQELDGEACSEEEQLKQFQRFEKKRRRGEDDGPGRTAGREAGKLSDDARQARGTKRSRCAVQEEQTSTASEVLEDEACIAERTTAMSRPATWKMLLMHALAKVAKANVIKDYRFLALQPTLPKWYMTALLLVLRNFANILYERRMVFSFGFEKGRSTRRVVTLIRQAL